MNDCVFCKIIAGEIPTTKIFEDDKSLVFLNIRPNNNGQTLVIPKEHYENYFETPDEVLESLSKLTKKIGIAVKKAVNADGINIIVNSEKAAGQVIFHTHIHIIPRYSTDGYKHWEPKEGYKGNEAEIIAEKIKSFI